MSLRKGNNLIAGVPDLSTYATVSEIEAKQDKLTAGANITITDNVISATGDSATPDTVTISQNTTGELQAIGVYEKNKSSVKYDWIGTTEEWTTGRSNGTIPDTWICYITDDYVDLTSYATTTALESAISEINTTIGNIDTLLDTINGETV